RYRLISDPPPTSLNCDASRAAVRSGERGVATECASCTRALPWDGLALATLSAFSVFDGIASVEAVCCEAGVVATLATVATGGATICVTTLRGAAYQPRPTPKTRAAAAARVGMNQRDVRVCRTSRGFALPKARCSICTHIASSGGSGG